MTNPNATSLAQTAALITRLRALLSTGAMGAVSNVYTASAPLHNLAHPAETAEAGVTRHGIVDGRVVRSAGTQHQALGEGWIISQRLLAVRLALASDDELICALLAQQPEVRAAWLAIAAARCKEAGGMSDTAPLVALVSGLGTAAAWVESALASAHITASPYATLERELLGVSFEQAAATPGLVRILATAAQLASFSDALPPLPELDASGHQVQQNWCHGRLLALPYVLDQAERKPTPDTRVILPGGIAPGFTGDSTVMHWVLTHPWALLLAMLAFAQDAWRAENRGGLLLELPAGQNAFAPTEVTVTVMGAEGDEVGCGTLADLLLGMLARLGVGCFPQQPTVASLNAQLAPLLGLLLKHSVWRYQDGAGSQPGQYQIHPQFSDQCYSLPASRVFNRTGKLLWQTARLSAEALYLERKNIR
jgi:hypothetical protein